MLLLLQKYKKADWTRQNVCIVCILSQKIGEERKAEKKDKGSIKALSFRGVIRLDRSVVESHVSEFVNWP